MKNMAPEVYNFRAAATRSALKLWTKHGIKPNRWTKIRDLLDIATNLLIVEAFIQVKKKEA